jgi:hypothetical protein
VKFEVERVQRVFLTSHLTLQTSNFLMVCTAGQI